MGMGGGGLSGGSLVQSKMGSWAQVYYIKADFKCLKKNTKGLKKKKTNGL